ncbi:uncharacterized protein N7483_008624 [Penicillium malachiteum]|uniref:uncharacterized protein n=1 Tax=Penicillium malachiteum TaxID=1324776 RepID=UPI0025469872|nr:uncharacterized protein N7483_008624 [Penicillium malachiteum]KAJ5720690.1 hypothetical protein N7483_008624 [Penicillium malachiteum]
MTERSLSENVKPSKQRTKTFTGCWTCRTRRVKCDEEHPHCRRCRRSGWQCQGYGVRLEWSQTPGIRAQRRQLRSSTPIPTHDLSSTAVTALLAELDGCSTNGGAQQRGPFSVFSASCSGSDNLKSSKSLDYSTSSSPSQVDGEDLVESFSHPLDQDSSVANPGEGDENKTLQSVELPGKLFLSLTDRQPVQNDTSITLMPIINVLSNSDHIQASEEFKPLSEPMITPRLPSIRSITPLQIPRPEIELIHHWVVFLSGNMLLIDTPDNPCRTVFMPLALKGLESQESSIHLSIFHAICASSAFSLYHLRGDHQYQSVAMRHDQLALSHLRQNLQRAKRLDEPTLAAVLTCITAEAMSGRRSRWRAHVAGGLGLLENEIHGGWIRGPTASRLLQSYLSLSSLCSLPMSTQLMALLNGPAELRHYLERSHGITAPLVQFLARITTIIDSNANLSTEELDRLELQLHLNFPSLSAPDEPESIIIQHALNSFYYASIICFRRTLRHAPLCDVQDLVEKAVQELEAMESLTHGKKGGCAYNWASFVVAAECQRPNLQARMIAYFDRKGRHGIQNIKMLCEIVKALWQRREGTSREIKWQEIANEADFDIMIV